MSGNSIKRLMTLAPVAGLFLVSALFLTPAHTAEAATTQKLSPSEVPCTTNTNQITLKVEEYNDANGPWHCYTRRGSFKPAYSVGTVCAKSYTARVYEITNNENFTVTVKAGTCNDLFDPTDEDIAKISNQ